MGLDMYLHAEKYVGGWNHTQNTEREQYERVVADFGMSDYMAEGSPHFTIQFTVGYWRKANAIHGWFVREVQDGVDECKPHEVSREQLQQLRDTCAKGFFGTYEIGEWYWSDLQETIEIIDRALTLPDSFWFVYRSSW